MWFARCLFVCVSLLVSVRVSAAPRKADRTVVRLTGKVLVRDVSRFGINLGGDAYYSGAALTKLRSVANFEGTSYRQCHFGPVQDARGATTWFGFDAPWARSWRDLVLRSGRYTILSGPAKGTSGRIVGISTKQIMHQGKVKPFTYFEFDKTVPPGPENTGLLVEAPSLREGQFRSLDGYWTSKLNHLVIGESPPGSFGCACLCLTGSQGTAHVRFSTHYQRYGETNGRWHVRFWMKAKGGSPTLRVAADRGYGEGKTWTVPSRWTNVEETIRVDKVPEPKGPTDNPHLLFRFEARRGDVLIDDVEIWREGNRNPTVFRDDVVAVLRRYHPGPIRYLEMGGSTLDNILAPPLRRYSYTSRRSHRVGPYNRHNRHPYSLPALYRLCEYLGAEPWYCLPGTLSRDEMRKFMEYLGAPPSVGYGKRRAELGHPKPWTTVFKHIHVEFGNEAWNNAGPYQCGGFNGKDYWKDLIALAKKSPYYKPNVLFHAGGQAANSWLNRRILADVPNADRLAVAPYLVPTLDKQDLTLNPDDDSLFRWVFAWPLWRSRDPRGAMRQNYELAHKAGCELSVYEINHHTTHGDAALGPRNDIVASLAGGLNVANTMLVLLKEHHARTQCLFSLIQHGYRAPSGVVRLWGTALCMRKGHERYRPTFLACEAVNKVIGGDLVETVQTGANPTFSARGFFYHPWKQPAKVETLSDISTIQSYGFSAGRERGLVLFNLDTTKPHRVVVRFAGKSSGAAHMWRLAADHLTANNEFEVGAPQVVLREHTVGGFASGHELVLPAHSLTAIRWSVRGTT